MKELFLDGWQFKMGDMESGKVFAPEGTGWEDCLLPHDWDAASKPDPSAPSGAGGGYAPCGVGWYRKTFLLSEESLEEHLSILFEGVYMDATVYLNGKSLGGCVYGYTSFALPFGDAARAGRNEIAVRVDNSRQPGSRWYTGSGIYRNVYLVRDAKVHLALYGIRAATNGLFYDNTRASLLLEAACSNELEQGMRGEVRFSLIDREGNTVSVSGCAAELAAKGTVTVGTRPEIENPHLWSDEDPYLYTLRVTLTAGAYRSEEEIRFGIRTARFDAREGFLLNGKRVKIKGVCLHHDSGMLGAAFYREVWERRLEELKEMGCNGIRSSHNPPSPGLLELCDELGFLVMDELCDEWRLGKNKNDNYYSQNLSYGYAQYFEQDVWKDLETMIRRDASHPSVVLWSVGNEIPEQSSIDGAKTAASLVALCHTLDPTRQVTIACDQIAAPPAMRVREDFKNAADVLGYNYMGRWGIRASTFLEEDREEMPGRPVVGTENPSAGGIRGAYTRRPGEDAQHYVTATMMHENMWRYIAAHDFVCGDYVWTGIDYRGEARWPMRGASSGPLDMAGFRKDTFYYFRSIWNEKEETLHLVPHWNPLPGEKEGDFRTVVCYTSCEKVALYLNGRLVATKGAYPCPRWGADHSWDEEHRRYHPTTMDLHLTFEVPYEPGVLMAEGYRDGKVVLTKKLETTGPAMRLACRLWKNGGTGKPGICQIEIEALDAAGRPVPDADCLVEAQATEGVRLMAMENGDPSDVEGCAAPVKRLFAGKLLVIARKETSAPASVILRAEGLPEEVVCL